MSAQKTYIAIMTCGALAVAVGAYSHYRYSVVSYARRHLEESQARQVAAWTGCTGCDSGTIVVTPSSSTLDDSLPHGVPQTFSHDKPKSKRKPESIDVPAIEIGANNCFSPKSDKAARCTVACKKGDHRILLQDEDGDWHCIKFPKELQ